MIQRRGAERLDKMVIVILKSFDQAILLVVFPNSEHSQVSKPIHQMR